MRNRETKKNTEGEAVRETHTEQYRARNIQRNRQIGKNIKCTCVMKNISKSPDFRYKSSFFKYSSFYSEQNNVEYVLQKCLIVIKLFCKIKYILKLQSRFICTKRHRKLFRIIICKTFLF